MESDPERHRSITRSRLKSADLRVNIPFTQLLLPPFIINHQYPVNYKKKTSLRIIISESSLPWFPKSSFSWNQRFSEKKGKRFFARYQVSKKSWKKRISEENKLSAFRFILSLVRGMAPGREFASARYACTSVCPKPFSSLNQVKLPLSLLIDSQNMTFSTTFFRVF